MLKPLIIILFLSINSYASKPIVDEFKQIYKKIDLPSYQLSLEKNIELIIDLVEKDEILKKVTRLGVLSRSCLTGIKCKIINHETERISMRLKFGIALKENKITSLEKLKNNKKIYAMSYKLSFFEWTNDFTTTFNELELYELEEIKKIRKKLRGLKKLVNQEVRSSKEVINYLIKVNKEVKKNVTKIFSQRDVPEIKFKLNTNPKSQHIPGYYDSSTGTFYFTMPDGKINLGDLDWLFLHEAVPGHHFQMKLDKGSFVTELIGRNYVYLDFIEGWAAYVETYGSELGVYKSTASKRKAYEWDLLRSVRVIIDIGIHKYGWSRDQAKLKWKSLAPEVLSLADREIDRIINWPAQVISYEFGKMKLIEAKRKFMKGNKSLLSFHEKILKRGQVPSYLLNE